MRIVQIATTKKGKGQHFCKCLLNLSECTICQMATESDCRVHAEGIMLLITDEAVLTRDKLTDGFCMCRWICCQIYKILHTHIKKKNSKSRPYKSDVPI